VPHKNNLGIEFLTDDGKFNEVAYKTDNQLRAMGYTIPVKKSEESKEAADGQ
jgi:hypothetical protein